MQTHLQARKVETPSNTITFSSKEGARVSVSIGGGGGGSVVDEETRRYVEAKSEATRAQNDARFAEVLSEIHSTNTKLVAKFDLLTERIAAIRPATWQQVAVVVFAGFTAALTVMAIASSSFVGGFQAGPAFEARVGEMADQQAKRDASQDAKVDQVLSKLDSLAAAVSSISDTVKSQSSQP